jgi:hypothetical protein
MENNNFCNIVRMSGNEESRKYRIAKNVNMISILPGCVALGLI